MSTLIIYATKHGAARKCAENLSQKITGTVDLYNLKTETIPDLTPYEKVIIGGSIYAGTMHKEIKEFCTKNFNTLKEKKIGLFICCMNKKASEMQLNNAFPKELLEQATAKMSFGGEFRFSEMNFMEKLITKMVSKVLSKEDHSLVIDTKKDLSMISEEAIYEFSKLLNSAS